MKNVIIKLPVHYHQQRIDKEDNNKGLLYGIYYFDIPVEDLNTDHMFDHDIIHVDWYKTKKERNNKLNK
jgi:hypothetical protein